MGFVTGVCGRAIADIDAKLSAAAPADDGLRESLSRPIERARSRFPGHGLLNLATMRICR